MARTASQATRRRPSSPPRSATPAPGAPRISSPIAADRRADRGRRRRSRCPLRHAQRQGPPRSPAFTATPTTAINRAERSVATSTHVPAPRPAPPGIQATITDGEYSPGTNINGIIWRKGFSELRVTLYNQSTHDYDNLSVLIQPTEPIAAIAQRTNIPGVLFYDQFRLQTAVIDINHLAGTQTAIPVSIVATDAGYLMHCIRLPAETSIEIEIALAEIRSNLPAQPSPSRPTEDKNFTVRIKRHDGLPIGSVTRMAMSICRNAQALSQ